MANNFPKLHNAAWPGVVGKGDGGEPPIDLDTMLNLTAAAEVNGVKFDGFDLFLYLPHIDIDSTENDDAAIRELAEKAQSRGLEIGTVVAPIWPPTGGGAAMGSPKEQRQFLDQVKKGCRVAERLRQLGVRPHGAVRIDSASGVEPWYEDPDGNQKRIADTFREACAIAEGHGEQLAAEGEICWGGMHSWRRMVQLLELVDRPQTLGFQADMAHTLLYILGYNAPEDALLPQDFDFSEEEQFHDAYKQTHRRPATLDDRLPRRPERRHGAWAPARTTRRAATAWRPTRAASSISPATPATGSATKRASRPGGSSTSAGTGACSPTP